METQVTRARWLRLTALDLLHGLGEITAILDPHIMTADEPFLVCEATYTILRSRRKQLLLAAGPPFKAAPLPKHGWMN